MRNVLIVGAGPVGLSMAAELARHRVRCRIVDRLAQPLSYCRAIGVTPRTLEIWDDMGIARSMIDAGLWLRGMRLISYGAPPQDFRIDLPDLPYGQLGIPQYETERILIDHLAGFGIKVERPVTAVSVSQGANTVKVGLQLADGGREDAEFQYVVGCDGAGSTVRRSLGIAFEGDHFPMDFMLGDVFMDCGLPRGLTLRAVRPIQDEPPDFFVAIPLPERNRYRVSMLAPQRLSDRAGPAAGHGLQLERQAPSLADLQEVADRLLPEKVQLSDMRWSSIFRIGMRLAGSYRVGNVFIAGDAAHIHPPTGGQGMNTGIQDAYNLAWKMALVLHGRASPALLDSFEAERRPVGAAVIAQTRAQSENLGREERKPEDRLAGTQILVNYRGRGWTKDDISAPLPDSAVLAGDRAPDCGGLGRENVHFPLRLFDVIRGVDHVLVIYISETIGSERVLALESLAHKLKAVRSPAIRLVVISPRETPIPEMIGVSVLRDNEESFLRTYGATTGTAYLIRPDGYIAYHARPLMESGLLAYLREASLIIASE